MLKNIVDTLMGLFVPKEKSNTKSRVKADRARKKAQRQARKRARQ